MPRQNGTGPTGYGPGSGWGMGPCGGGRAYGRKIGGRGLGWRRFFGYYPGPALSQKDEAKMLGEEAEAMEQELKNIKNRLAELKK